MTLGLADGIFGWCAVALCLIWLVPTYIIYQRYFHPLAKFPGEFAASITDFTKASYFCSLSIDKKILSLHEKYGPVVRISPNELSFWDPEALSAIFKSGGRAMTKSSFFDGFTTFDPNLFGNRNEEACPNRIHALRRRQMAHSFSTASLISMEEIFDRHVMQMRDKLDRYAKSGEKLNLKKIIAFYAYDVLGELAFDTQFESQVKDDESNLPPINDHIFLGCLYGSLPSLLPYSMKLSGFLPIPWLQTLNRSRQSIRNTVARCVSTMFGETLENDEKKSNTLLSQLMKAKDPETGKKLTVTEISSEAFGFLVAGSHTTSGTLTLLFYHLLHDSEIYSQVVEEMRRELPLLEQGAYPYTGLEAKLPYTTACMRENFRHTPVFTMPLTRQVMSQGGTVIAGTEIPAGTNVSITNHALHHNPSIWGPDCDEYKPSRWLRDGYAKENLKYLMPFGAGHRMCIGRNIAMANMLKVVSVVLRNYELEAVDKDEPLKVVTVGIGEKEGPLWCRIKKMSC
ncbi:hypothetical protein N5P37_011608 [Trichoderma harzianum]|uniref:Cytochrome P450 n=1 Tax=Trichoderma harzianum CBS 226.95 TaxID=983964 RepID=A0A2T3ZSS6_TRIHA|nr:hypothetical protein M431DRAFT_525860 [Trichoderma harzianum CBS 226.95]KAK0755827.1 hypothetical protein N5P37_011608 [Trichoderma harzianum]PKK48234.1 hypothetical protein CI102_7860 [Trichoderma harzianum]PTB47848.1 hypothetical protein M431DRAFT_525860 [Trichoderma harzianum CBS 226.95]